MFTVSGRAWLAPVIPEFPFLAQVNPLDRQFLLKKVAQTLKKRYHDSMERGSWPEISGDAEIWKKVAVGAGCFLTLLPLPFLFGTVHQDLEAENQRIESKEAPGPNLAAGIFLVSQSILRKIATIIAKDIKCDFF